MIITIFNIDVIMILFDKSGASYPIVMIATNDPRYWEYPIYINLTIHIIAKLNLLTFFNRIFFYYAEILRIM